MAILPTLQLEGFATVFSRMPSRTGPVLRVGVPGTRSLLGDRIRGTLGDIDPLNKVLLKRARSLGSTRHRALRVRKRPESVRRHPRAFASGTHRAIAAEAQHFGIVLGSACLKSADSHEHEAPEVPLRCAICGTVVVFGALAFTRMGPSPLSSLLEPGVLFATQKCWQSGG